jgi:hypothetical protein
MTLNTVTLLKTSGERFVFIFDETSHAAALETFERFAADESLDFNEIDATAMRALLEQFEQSEAGAEPESQPVNRLYKYHP